MALTDITDHILEEAKEQKAAIEAEARQEIERIQNETRAKKEEMKQTSDEWLQREMNHRREQARARAQREKQQKLEATKRERIDKVYADALSRLVNLDDSEYEQLITRLASELPADIDGSVTVPATRNEETTQALKNAGVTLQTTASDDIDGGFIVHSDKAEYDYRFEYLVDQVRRDTELAVAETLFNQS